MFSALLLCPEFTAPLPRWLVAASLALAVAFIATLGFPDPQRAAASRPVAPLASAHP